MAPRLLREATSRVPRLLHGDGGRQAHAAARARRRWFASEQDGIRRDGAARREGDCERIGENALPPPYETLHDHTASSSCWAPPRGETHAHLSSTLTRLTCRKHCVRADGSRPFLTRSARDRPGTNYG